MNNKLTRRVCSVFICIALILLSAGNCNAAFTIRRVIDSPKVIATVRDTTAHDTAGHNTTVHDTTGSTQHVSFFKRAKALFAKQPAPTHDEARPARHKRSGIFGRLSFYFGLLSCIGFVVALCTLFTSFLTAALVIWLYSAFFAVILGIIGMVQRKKKGMAIAGIILGVAQFALLAAVVSFISAAASALPEIMAGILIIGHG